MHKSGDGDAQTASVRIYLDESGTSDPNTPQAVVAGLIINKSGYKHFEDEWEEMLKRYNIPFMHMKEFRQNGKLRHLSVPQKINLFTDIAGIVGKYKIASICASITNSQYESIVPSEAREIFSVYGMCFLLAEVMNHKLADGKYPGKIPFFLDQGNPYASHVTKAHAESIAMQKNGFYLHAGGLHFDDDEVFGVLQAADVIAWGCRRAYDKKDFPKGMEPITQMLIPEQGHNENSWTPELLKLFRGSVQKRIEEIKATKDVDEEEF